MTSDRAEIDRIRAAHGERCAAVGDKWHPLLPSQVANDAARRRVWGQELLRLGRDLGRVVEVGCGSGQVLRWALDAGATEVTGVDLVLGDLVRAKGADHRGRYALGDGRRLPFRAASFDTAVCSLVFSQFLSADVAGPAAAEIDRVLRPGGVVLFFDIFRRNRRNPHIRPVRQADLGAMFPRRRLVMQHVVLAPPIARRLERHSRLAEALELVRPLRTHVAGVLVEEPR